MATTTLTHTGTEPLLAAEIELVAHRVVQLYEQQRGYLVDKPTPVIAELQHRCEEARSNENYSVRVAAEVNFAACEMLLTARGHASQRNGGKR
jgi:hypothetical protein